eukprot:3675417-Lingulodinium_polyedra.AAC.1
MGIHVCVGSLRCGFCSSGGSRQGGQQCVVRVSSGVAPQFEGRHTRGRARVDFVSCVLVVW